MLVEWLEKSVRSSPGELSFLWHFANELWTAKKIAEIEIAGK